MNRLVIGTRGSALARTQTEWVAQQLRDAHPNLEIETVIIKTKGDKITDVPLAKIGGKGLFTKELEVALVDGRIDIAVHSLKDLPTELPEGIALAAVPVRESPYDALVSTKYDSIGDLPKGATVGTSSLRRQAQLRATRPDLDIVDLRGNIDTRIGKVESGELDGAILAAAGLNRLGRADAIAAELGIDDMMPAVAQGALGIEARIDDSETQSILEAVHHEDTWIAARAERAFLSALEGGCQVPLGGHATLNDENISMVGAVWPVDGSKSIAGKCDGSVDDPESVGRALADDLLALGAGELIAALR